MTIHDTTAQPNDGDGVHSQAFDLPTTFLVLLGLTEIIRETFEHLLFASLPNEVTTPEVGEVRQGHAFLGGSPVDPNNWLELR
ncbi:MAG: hypothetical protein KGK33_06885 [Hyphomicrobiales bacterium]|nr:hypothetical protein [Hyphomicrobiales bacterium]